MEKKKIHIAFIIANSSSVPYFLWFAEKAKNDPDLKFTFVALYHSKPDMMEQLKTLGADCIWIPFDHKKRKRSLFKVIPKLYRLFKHLDPDIVHSHLFDDSLPSLIAAKLAGIKLRFITKQDTFFHWLYAPGIVKFDKLNNLLATDIIATSEECKDFILNNEKANPSKVKLVHHGINIDQFANINEGYKSELRKRFGLQNKTVIGTIARLIEWKGHAILLDVAEKAVKQYPDVVFLFVGEGELKSKLETIIIEKKLEKNVVLTGWVERKKIPSLYSIMDIYIHAARYEPFGFVIAEAMLMGTPVLSTKTGAARDAIDHKENGYLVDYDNVDGFVEGIDFLMKHNKIKIGEKGKQKAEQMYNFKKMWSGYTSLYKSAMAR